jgi:hypothetical protein
MGFFVGSSFECRSRWAITITISINTSQSESESHTFLRLADGREGDEPVTSTSTSDESAAAIDLRAAVLRFDLGAMLMILKGIQVLVHTSETLSRRRLIRTVSVSVSSPRGKFVVGLQMARASRHECGQPERPALRNLRGDQAHTSV